ncbi:carboxyl-terminal-processing peptidase 2, chloroplastic-like isoform X2 [Glycine soja]|nr:carboxyl-terminal-processing peptidase 2, chloroplastic isoform X2 [Glycine max]XP_028184019.1 carboxyl-terminal-processing peptidase 2, chloroplastic-like isoform X2 [Glycine soja]XP_040861756.1 carboxyl-terminal-processing peptidase 2, chloroplastic isoform X2 [Glycine max]|eukprot:XP_006589318.1 carboxyl-terminal-processing peptidase 2, chloroplastic isoform X2 [Glycine max]
MLATLDDPFTRFLEPEKFRSLRSGTEGALTGVGLSIGYPTKAEMQPGGLVVISASPGGPAYRVGVLSGDVILAIDCTSTENMGLYDAAERLQREKVSLDPVKSRLCKLPASGNDSPTVGYIKLTSFNQKASSNFREPTFGKELVSFPTILYQHHFPRMRMHFAIASRIQHLLAMSIGSSYFQNDDFLGGCCTLVLCKILQFF